MICYYLGIFDNNVITVYMLYTLVMVQLLAADFYRIGKVVDTLLSEYVTTIMWVIFQFFGSLAVFVAILVKFLP